MVTMNSRQLLQSETALRESEQRLRLMVRGVRGYAIFMLDPEGRVSDWNCGAERINGYRSEEIIGKHCSCFYGAEDVAAGIADQQLETARATGGVQAEGWRFRKDGSRFWASVSITAIRDDQENLRASPRSPVTSRSVWRPRRSCGKRMRPYQNR